MIKEGAVEGVITHITEKELVGKKELPKITVVLEEQGAEYPASIAVDFIGDKTNHVSKIKEGDEVLLYINVRCNEYKGKYYNSINGRRVQKTNQNKSSIADIADDLPF